jgi:hypothetical protein
MLSHCLPKQWHSKGCNLKTHCHEDRKLTKVHAQCHGTSYCNIHTQWHDTSHCSRDMDKALTHHTVHNIVTRLSDHRRGTGFIAPYNQLQQH